MILVEPCMEAELHDVYDTLVNRLDESAYLRLVSVKWPMPFDYPVNQRLEVGKGWIVREGSDAVVFGYGPWMLANAFEAAAELERTTGVSVRVVNLPWLNRIDSSWLQQVVGNRRAVVTLDNHYVQGGQGQMIAAAIAALGREPAVRVTSIGVTELPECGTNDEVLAYHGLDVAGLIRQIGTAIGETTRQRPVQLA
jgi:transketolase